MGRKKERRSIGTKKSVENEKPKVNEALKTCPYEKKECLECEIQDCPEEQG